MGGKPVSFINSNENYHDLRSEININNYKLIMTGSWFDMNSLIIMPYYRITRG